MHFNLMLCLKFLVNFLINAILIGPKNDEHEPKNSLFIIKAKSLNNIHTFVEFAAISKNCAFIF